MPQLHILSGKRQGETFQLEPGGEVDIGNRKSAQLSIRDPWVSYNHARIVSESGRFVIEDQDSSNGTWLDAPSGPRRIKRHELSPNDVFALGKTRIKFVADAPAPVTAAFGTAPGQTMRLPGDQPWWDRGVQPSEPARTGGSEAARAGGPAGGASPEQELREERKMRAALERFLELPPGTPLGDAARAGALEREVQELKKKLERAGTGGGGSGSEDVERLVGERTEKLRQDLVKKTVELEGRAAAAEARAVDLERRLLEKAEQTKKEVARAREKAQSELDGLKQALEQARASNRDLAAGGDTALESERQRGDALEAELERAREKARQLEELADQLGRELSEATAARPDPGLQARLEEALAEAERWKGEHQAVIQEIDDISMEQIEIEDGLKARIKELEAQLAALGAQPAPASAPTSKGGKGAGKAATAAGRGSAPAQPATPARSSDVATYDSASLGMLPTSELGASPPMDEADLTSSSESSDDLS